MSAMHLRLSLPPRAETPNAETETRPAEVGRWLAQLPILNVSETTLLIARQLATFNRMPLDDKVRLRLLELFRAPVQHVCRELQKAYIGLPLPLPNKARQIVLHVNELQTEMAYGYKTIAYNSTAITRFDDDEKKLLAIALHRGIRYLTELLFRGYELYNPPPEGTWFEIHQLYRYAEVHGITDTPLDDPLNSTLPQVSVSHAYKQALLLDFCDPYHLPVRMLERVYRYLDRWAQLAQLSPGISALRSQCQFLINLDNDHAGAVNTEASPITTEARYRLLNTTDLARNIHQQLTQFHGGQHPDPEGLEKDFFANLGHDMLMRLLNAWGVNPKRTFTRQLRENHRIDVAFNIDTINFFVNGAEPFSPSTSEVGPQLQRTAIGRANDTPNKVRQGGTPEKTTWEVVDESAGGYSLAKSGAQDERVRVGDLVASRPQGNGKITWEIGVVRWARTTGADNIELGVQRLSPAAAAVAVMPIEDSQDTFFLALALPEVRPMKQPPTLITPRGFFKSDRVFYLDNGFRTRQIRAQKLIELSGAFERFQYEAIDS